MSYRRKKNQRCYVIHQFNISVCLLNIKHFFQGEKEEQPSLGLVFDRGTVWAEKGFNRGKGGDGEGFTEVPALI